MVKKFSFNFKFLDRFKKKSSDSDLPPIDDLEEEEIPSFEEMPRASKREFTPLDDLNNDTEFGNVEASEEFAEKTLSNFKVPKLNPEIELLLAQSAEERANNPEAFADEDQTDDQPINFSEMQPPTKPAEAQRIKFNFSSFGKDSFKNFKGSNINFKNSFQKIEKVSWNEIVLKIFSPYSRGKIHNTFLVVLVICITYLLGKTAALFTNRTTKIDIKPRSTITIPQDRQDSAITDISKITSTNLFNAKETEEVKAKGPRVDISQIHCVEADRPTSKQLKLLDTIVLQDSVKSVASVQIRGGSDLLNIREGETLDGSSEVAKIQRMKLILKNLETGDCEYLSSEREDEMPMVSPIKVLPPGVGKNLFKSNSPFIKNTGNNFKIKKTYRDQMVTKMSEVLTQAKAIQITNPDGTLSFKMTEIVPGSIYSQLNIQENDIITQINGRKIDNLNELMGLLGRIKEIDSMQIGLKRNGMQENLDYNFE